MVFRIVGVLRKFLTFLTILSDDETVQDVGMQAQEGVFAKIHNDDGFVFHLRSSAIVS